MTDDEIIRAAIEEIKTKSWGITEQFLQIHEIICVDGVPKLDRLDRDKQDGTAIAYFPVKDEKFHLAIYIEFNSFPEVKGIAIEPYNDLFFQASSDTLDFDELSAFTNLRPTNGWRKGDMRKSGKALYKYTLIRFIPNPEPDEFEDKLKKLLDFLEQDSPGIKKLVEVANGHIQAAIIFHNGNTMLGGVQIDNESMKRMAALNLQIDFDLYAEGKFFK
jgi:hypothetical protein